MKIKLLGVLFTVFMLSSCSTENVQSSLAEIPATIGGYISQITG